MGKIIEVNEKLIKDQLGEMVRGTVASSASATAKIPCCLRLSKAAALPIETQFPKNTGKRSPIISCSSS